MKKLLLIVWALSLNILFAETKTIVFLGDSLTEGYGLEREEAFPNIVQTLIETKLNKKMKVINAGVSGSTSSDGLARLKWYLKREPSVIFIALGANDGLRGLDLKESQKNLESIISIALASQAKVLLAGMLIPPNYGQAYSENFKNMYLKLADKYSLKLMPFLLDGVAGEKALNQSDGIHPNKEGQQRIANNVFEFIKSEL
ncbi:MAG: arylesterase [Campylobacterota bacterium]|nr:arylesterase [Campylobacterota bacterium]